MSDQYPIPSPGRPVWVYIDDSNIAIGGRKLRYQGTTRSRPSWDYDIDFLFNIIYGELDYNAIPFPPPARLNFYGADLHRNPHLECLRVLGWVEGYDCPRNRRGQEKEADVRLAMDMTDRARYAWDFRDPCHFVLVSGDGDFIPVVKKALEYGLNVHIWSWQASLSRRFNEFEQAWNGNPQQWVGQIRIHFLDPYLDSLTRSPG